MTKKILTSKAFQEIKKIVLKADSKEKIELIAKKLREHQY